jgi:hypothetical protein
MPALAEVVSALILLLAFVALVVTARLNKVRNLDLERARKHRDRFFKVAELVVSDERTPEDLVRIVMLLASGMTRKVSLYPLLSPPKQPTRKPDIIVRLDDLPNDLGERVFQVLMDAICTLTYQSVLFGPLIRRRFCLDDNRPERERQNSGGVDKKVQALACKVAKHELRHAHAT